MHALKILAGYEIHPKHILHIGAHWGQEAAAYKALGVEFVLFVEAIPQIFAKLQKNLTSFPEFQGVRAVCSDTTGAEVTFNVSSNEGGSSSLLGLGNHANLYPEISYVETLRLTATTADDLVEKEAPSVAFDMLVLDTQGAEMLVLRGADRVLNMARSLLIEVSEDPLYEGGCTFEEVTAHVRRFGFRLRQIQINRQGWGDALYVKCAEAKTQTN